WHFQTQKVAKPALIRLASFKPTAALMATAGVRYAKVFRVADVVVLQRPPLPRGEGWGEGAGQKLPLQFTCTLTLPSPKGRGFFSGGLANIRRLLHGRFRHAVGQVIDKADQRVALTWLLQLAHRLGFNLPYPFAG